MKDYKWIVVMGVEEYREDLNDIFFKSGITVFSEVAVKGFRYTQSRLEGDSSQDNKLDPTYSLVSFAMTQEDKAKTVLAEINHFNSSMQKARPLHAFQVNIEAMA